MTEPEHDPATICRGLAEVTAAVELARQTAAEGGLVDLSGLDARVDALCRAVVALPRAEGRGFEAALLELIDTLTRLHETLTRQQPAAGLDPAAGTTPREAASAYRRTQS